jgi:hypothetical protein
MKLENLFCGLHIYLSILSHLDMLPTFPKLNFYLFIRRLYNDALSTTSVIASTES